MVTKYFRLIQGYQNLSMPLKNRHGFEKYAVQHQEGQEEQEYDSSHNLARRKTETMRVSQSKEDKLLELLVSKLRASLRSYVTPDSKGNKFVVEQAGRANVEKQTCSKPAFNYEEALRDYYNNKCKKTDFFEKEPPTKKESTVLDTPSDPAPSLVTPRTYEKEWKEHWEVGMRVSFRTKTRVDLPATLTNVSGHYWCELQLDNGDVVRCVDQAKLRCPKGAANKYKHVTPMRLPKPQPPKKLVVASTTTVSPTVSVATGQNGRTVVAIVMCIILFFLVMMLLL